MKKQVGVEDTTYIPRSRSEWLRVQSRSYALEASRVDY